MSFLFPPLQFTSYFFSLANDGADLIGPIRECCVSCFLRYDLLLISFFFCERYSDLIRSTRRVLCPTTWRSMLMRDSLRFGVPQTNGASCALTVIVHLPGNAFQDADANQDGGDEGGDDCPGIEGQEALSCRGLGFSRFEFGRLWFGRLEFSGPEFG
jgi:hypothetical protein